MGFEDKLKDKFRRAVERLFDLDKLKFESISIKQDVIDELLQFARSAYPKEFVAFSEGKIANNKLTITHLAYQEYTASENAAMPIFHFSNRSYYGSVHSHPSYSNRPSREDILFFRKMGIVHAIVSRPFDVQSIGFYDHDGQKLHIDIEQ